MIEVLVHNFLKDTKKNHETNQVNWVSRHSNLALPEYKYHYPYTNLLSGNTSQHVHANALLAP
jgi:hypothetical protein